MEKRMYRVHVRWIIEHNTKHFSQCGESTISGMCRDTIEAVNMAITFCRNVPICDLEENGIDVKHYVEGTQMLYHSNIIEIERIFILPGGAK